MKHAQNLSALATIGLLIVGCTNKMLPPALPDDQVILAPTIEYPVDEPRYLTPKELTDMLRPLPPIVASPKSMPLEEALAPQKSGKRCAPRCKAKHEPTLETLVDSANTEATIRPKLGALHASAIMRYDHSEDSIFEIYAAPNAPAFVRLPPGHHLAAPATLNPEEWVMSKVEMTLPGDIDQQGWLILPAKAGLEGYMNLISKEGFVAKCKVRSFKKTAMLEVAWNWTSPAIPQALIGNQGTQPQEPTSTKMQPLNKGERDSLILAHFKADTLKTIAPKLKPPALNVDRLHTGYTIEVISKQKPAWVPTSVMDDATKTVLKFKGSLAFTSAPDLFAVHADKTPAPVEFVPYVSENGETMLYIVPGLFPQLSLRGKDGMEVKITRVPNDTQK